jgi:hypothetical protein
MSFLDDLEQWKDFDGTALALGRALGVFSPDTDLRAAKALLWTNSAVGNTLYGLLERLAWLGILECDEEARRYRAAPPRLHPLGAPGDVPALEAGPPPASHIAMSVDASGDFSLEANRAGFRHLARVFEEIANSGLQSGWRCERDPSFKPGAGPGGFSFVLAEAVAPDGEEEP